MSYARFGAGGSDVYVFLSIDGYLECCACNLQEPRPASACFDTTEEMLEHLREHRRAGDHVTDDTMEHLREDAEENDTWIAREAGRQL